MAHNLTSHEPVKKKKKKQITEFFKESAPKGITKFFKDSPPVGGGMSRQPPSPNMSTEKGPVFAPAPSFKEGPQRKGESRKRQEEANRKAVESRQRQEALRSKLQATLARTGGRLSDAARKTFENAEGGADMVRELLGTQKAELSEGAGFQEVSGMFAKQSPSSAALGLVGGGAAKVGGKLLKEQVFKSASGGVASLRNVPAGQAGMAAKAAGLSDGVSEIVAKFSAKFDAVPEKVAKAAAGLRTQQAARGVVEAENFKNANLIKKVSLKAGKWSAWLGGAMITYLFSTQLTFNIKDDASRGLMIRANKLDPENPGDRKEFAELAAMQEELEDSVGEFMTYAPVINFPVQAAKNIMMNGMILNNMREDFTAGDELMSKQSKWENDKQLERIRDEQYFEGLRVQAEKARSEQRSADEAYFNKLREEGEARKVQERVEEEKYWMEKERQRRKRKDRERKEDEEYFRLLREAQEARDAQALLDAEAYWKGVMEKRLEDQKFQQVQRELYAPSQLTFGLLR